MTFPTEDMPLTHILVVSEIERSRRWYADVLGANLHREYGGDSAVLSFNGSWLLLVTGGDPTDDKPTVTLASPTDPDRLDHLFTIRVPDCRAAYEILRSRGAEFLTPPLDHGAETRCFFRDPDGHLFEISEYRADARATPAGRTSAASCGSSSRAAGMPSQKRMRPTTARPSAPRSIRTPRTSARSSTTPG